jgi:hypothetical protein
MFVDLNLDPPDAQSRTPGLVDELSHDSLVNLGRLPVDK